LIFQKVADVSELNLQVEGGGGMKTHRISRFSPARIDSAPPHSLSKTVSSADRLGKISSSTAFLSGSNGTNSTVTDTGSIPKLTFKAIRTGQTQLNFLQSDLRDINDGALKLSQVLSAVVNVK
jgi:hypothetical protein